MNNRADILSKAVPMVVTCEVITETSGRSLAPQHPVICRTTYHFHTEHRILFYSNVELYITA